MPESDGPHARERLAALKTRVRGMAPGIPVTDYADPEEGAALMYQAALRMVDALLPVVSAKVPAPVGLPMEVG